jgi:hypothetical protein
MKVNTQIDDFSFTSIKVRPYFNDICCSEAATAFCQVDDHGQPHLITNWHVVSGRNSDTGRNLDERTGIRPNKLRISPHKSIGTEEVAVELYDGDGPRWLTHPANGRLVDVAGVPIGDVPRHQWQPINRLQQSPLAIVEGDDVFILDFQTALLVGSAFRSGSEVPSARYRALIKTIFPISSSMPQQVKACLDLLYCAETACHLTCSTCSMCLGQMNRERARILHASWASIPAGSETTESGLRSVAFGEQR